MLGPRLRIEHVGDQLRLVDAAIALFQGKAVAAWDEVHATVVDRCIFECEPETDAGLRFRVDVSGILVADHFSADSRWLEDIHGLNDGGIIETDAFGDLCERRRA